ncbi:MAG: hypothetical protein HOP10_10500 [Chitinophagaceae bacterium]|nr:hypothetical protein [Chitinophagaceae bacterium]
MKKYLTILFSLLLVAFTGFAQADSTGTDDAETGGKLQERMKEYIQKKLNLSKGESEKFSPVFMRYMLELRKTNREFKGDGIMRASKIAELRVKYRGEFRQIIDEQRADRIFKHEIEFKEIIRKEINDRTQKNRIRPRTRAVIIQRQI